MLLVSILTWYLMLGAVSQYDRHGENRSRDNSRTSLDDRQGSLKNCLLRRSYAIDRQGLDHLASPVLKYVHAIHPELSPARVVLLLSDTVFLLELDMSGSLTGITRVLRSSIDNFIALTRANNASARSGGSEKTRLAGVAATLGWGTDAVDFDRS